MSLKHTLCCWLRALNLRWGWGEERVITSARLFEISLMPDGSLEPGFDQVEIEHRQGLLLRLWRKAGGR